MWSAGCEERSGPRIGGAAEPYALAHASGKYTQLIPILRHRASGDLDAALLQDVDDRLIGERMLGVLLSHELLDLGLDAACRHILSAGGRQSRREEELERQNPTRGLH